MLYASNVLNNMIKNQFKINRQFIQFLFWLGPSLIVMGLSAGVVIGSWEPITLILIITGVVILGLWFLFQAYFKPQDQSQTPYGRRRATQAGTNALASTVSVFLILGLINFVAIRNNFRIDLTENQQFTLSPQTQNLVKTFEQPLKVWVFDRGKNPQIQELLANYQRLGGKNFQYEFIDPQAQPGLAQQFGVKEFGEIYLESGKKRQRVRKEALEPLTELKLTNNIAQLFSNRTPKVYFIEGHGERPLTEGQGGLSEAIKSLTEKNFIAEPLNLAEQTAVPSDADVIILASPQRKLFEGEVKALETYLDQGGSVLLLLDPQTNHGLDGLLEKWGVKVDPRLAIDGSGGGRLVGLGPTVPIVREYGKHPITQDFGNGISIYPYASPVETRTIDGITEIPLIWTNDQTWAESDLKSPELKLNPEVDRAGPLSLGVALSRPQKQAEKSQTKPSPSPSPEKSEARLVVFGNSQFATNGWFGQQLNADVFLNSVSWLSQSDQETLSIRPKLATSRRIAMTPLLGQTLSWLALLVLPIFGFGMAVFVWWKRR
jgi:ABC-type uncharacterized transport system involved in gliding motility auxiliary subunit